MTSPLGPSVPVDDWKSLRADQVGTKSGLSEIQVHILEIAMVPKSIQELMVPAGRTNRTKFRDQVLAPLLECRPPRDDQPRQASELAAAGPDDGRRARCARECEARVTRAKTAPAAAAARSASTAPAASPRSGSSFAPRADQLARRDWTTELTASAASERPCSPRSSTLQVCGRSRL